MRYKDPMKKFITAIIKCPGFELESDPQEKFQSVCRHLLCYRIDRNSQALPGKVRIVLQVVLIGQETQARIVLPARVHRPKFTVFFLRLHH